MGGVEGSRSKGFPETLWGAQVLREDMSHPVSKLGPAIGFSLM